MALVFASGRDYLRDELVLDGIARGVHDAGNPYYDHLFGDAETARRVLRDWVCRPSSEAYAGRAQLLVDAGRPVGGFIAMTGAECRACRLADALALFSLRQEGLAARSAAAKGLFVTPESTDWIVSKMWVNPEFRRLGLGHVVAAAAFLPEHQGPGRTVADVHVDNVAARQTYLKLGVTEVATKSAPGGLTYVTLAIDRPRHPSRQRQPPSVLGALVVQAVSQCEASVLEAIANLAAAA